MTIYTKIAAKDSCNFALNKGNSNETNIKITSEIASLFGSVPEPDESYDVSFTILKADYINSLCHIMSDLPLFSNKGILIRFSESLFKSKLQQIEDFFGDQPIKEIKAKLKRPGAHPICLNFGAGNFCIRDFLVENRSLLTFTGNDGVVKLNVTYDINAAEGEIENEATYDDSAPLQQIYFGAPGTGKSHGVKVETEAWEKKGRVVRTTFHPDSDYSTFVGAYKPTVSEKPMISVFGTSAKQISKEDGTSMFEKIITYEFVAQAFLQAYVAAWTNREEPEYLIIEEINRGNCAQIFGDLFQLLDRGDDGYSEYAIKTDKDMQEYLSKILKNADIEDYPKVENGTEMVLPSNLFIRATMNTSDQSLFPIDSAFKRRWEWKYIPITDAAKGFRIEADGIFFDWWDFISKINNNIAEATSSEDKKLGYFFCKAKDGVISADKFVSKVIFYLYNDVFKDADDALQIFNDEEGRRMSFDSFYKLDRNGLSVADGAAVRTLLDRMEVMHCKSDDEFEDVGEGDVIEVDEPVVSENTVFNINDKRTPVVAHVAKLCIEEYIRLNPEMTAQQVYDVWSRFDNCNHFKKVVFLRNELSTLNSKNIRLVDEFVCGDGSSVWVYRNGWTHNPAKNQDTLQKFIDAVNSADLGISISEEQI